MTILRTLALALLATSCALGAQRVPREVVVLAPRTEARSADLTPAVPEVAFVATDEPGEPAAAEARQEARAPRSRRFEIESAALTRAFGRPRTVGAEVVLPRRFGRADDFAIVYHVPDVGADPAEVAERFAEWLPDEGLVLVVLDPRGIWGHHLFVDSVNEGPQGEALVTDLIPVLEQHLAAGAFVRRRFVTGAGLGGWSAIRLQLEYCHAFDATYAFDPDAVDLRCFYGTNLVRTADEAPAERRARSLRDERLAARIASFESAAGPRGSDGHPVSLFAGAGDALLPEVVTALARRDPASHVRLRGRALAPRLERKIHAVARAGDELARDRSLRSFEAELEAAGIASGIRTPEAYDLREALVGAWASMLAGPSL